MENQRNGNIPLVEAALVIIVTFFLTILLGGAFLFAFGDAVALVLGEIVILLVPLFYLLFKRVNVRNYIHIDTTPKFFALGLVAAIAMIFLNIAVSNLLFFFFGPSQAVDQSNQLILSTSTTTFGLVMVATSLALAGVCEEFAFRGFLFNSILKSLSRKSPQVSKYSLAVALLISAAVFGIFHFDPQGIYTLSAFISGIALGYIYYRTNYVTSAAAHGIMNLIVLALLLFGIG